ncbi:MAG: YggS family pyridoxal phosphate-dependent enzyme [Clostridia bacterium]|nr:YggS family pyridoxal phosphate-dependent enzyme [Clostridia bacterium]
MFGKITERVQEIKREISAGNPFGEKVILVAATKMQTAESINEAILAGVDAVAENKVQEFRDKDGLLEPCPQHFIGHLQTNKVKYLVGKIDLFHSCDRDALAEEIARQSIRKGVVSNVLIQINVSQEESKGGYEFEEGKAVFERLSKMEGLRVRGFMAMLEESTNVELLREHVRKMRGLFNWAKTQADGIEYLSMGMSGDYRLCVENGSNMVRLGSTIFGARDYGKKE